MQRRSLPAWFGGLAVAAVAIAADAQPDLEGFWTPRLEQTRSGQALIDELPDGVVLINDTGAGELAAGDFAGLELTPAAIEEVRRYDFGAELKRENTCNAPTAAFFMQAPFPMEVYQSDELIVFKMEYFDLVRVVFLDGRSHPPATAPHSRVGHSVGRWEGNTLVVDVANNNGKARLARTAEFASENVRIEERYIFANDGRRYLYEAVYTDPTVYSRPFTVRIPAKKFTEESPQDDWHNQTFPATHPGGELIMEAYERTCVENNEGHGEVAAKASAGS